MTGLVFNIQHYCIHDGPGIRTNVFLKGCPLRCAWCANPESNTPQPQLMFLPDTCVGCRACIPTCPNEAIVLTAGGEKVRQLRDRCTGCGACVDACRAKAREIAGTPMTVEAVMDEVRADKLFYGSEGGITVSGGECLMQPEFTAALLAACKAEGIHTAIETCGFAAWPTVQTVAADLDLALYDLKHMDSHRHAAYTGVPNEPILNNLHRLSDELGIPVIARMPFLPGINDDADNLHAMGQFLSTQVPTLVEVNLLPYHRMGESKWQQLEATGHTEVETHIPSEDEVESARCLLRTYGLTVK